MLTSCKVQKHHRPHASAARTNLGKKAGGQLRARERSLLLSPKDEEQSLGMLLPLMILLGHCLSPEEASLTAPCVRMHTVASRHT